MPRICSNSSSSSVSSHFLLLLVFLISAASTTAFTITSTTSLIHGGRRSLSRSHHVVRMVTSFEEQAQKGYLKPPSDLKPILERLRQSKMQSNVKFEEVTKVIEANYDYTAKPFMNGDVVNEAGTNAGSCKLLSMAILLGLDAPTTLALWGENYRGVIMDPKGTAHGNIRAMISKGWAGVKFPEGLSLTPKA